ncbi:hypothetical protein HY632_04075 [Candidatus Uhrbacteria bacterium]|nr:hypothetical protein [Candidatus Uhrbacteria bacterium]
MRLFCIMLPDFVVAGFRRMADPETEILTLTELPALPDVLRAEDRLAIPIGLFVELTRYLRNHHAAQGITVFAILPPGTVSSNETTAQDGVMIIYASEDEFERLPGS